LKQRKRDCHDTLPCLICVSLDAMHGNAKFAGFFLIAVGILYLRKPDLFRRGIWLKTSIAQRNLSPEGYIKYMRGVGVFNIVLGIALLVWAFSTS
jgi:hypothetical protein